jgi:flagellin
MTSDDASNSVLVGSRASIEVQDIDTDIGNDLAKWKNKSFKMSINGGETITVNTNGTYLAADGTTAADGAGKVASPTTFSHIVTNINASIKGQLNTTEASASTAGVLAANDPSYGLEVVAVYTTGSDTLEFKINSGVSNQTSKIVLSEVADGAGISSSSLDFTSVKLTATDQAGAISISSTNGGATAPTQTVRYVSQIDISTRDSALLAMTVVDAALQTIASNRGSLGAVANRLESTIQNLMTTSENTSASLSRIMDADYAEESTRLARAQVLQQASISILAQANATTQSVLKLLE